MSGRYSTGGMLDRRRYSEWGVTMRQNYLKPFAFTVLTAFSVASIYNMHQQLQGPMTAVKNDIAISTRNNNDCLSRVHNVRDIKMYSQNDEDGALLQTLRCMAWEATDQRNTLNLTLNQALKSILVSLEIYMAGPDIYSTDLLKILIFRFTRIF
jgi:hypothetical protein